MPAKENKKQYDMQYAKDKLKRIPLNVQKEKYAEIKAAADAAGDPINGYIKKAIDDRMERKAAGSRATQQTPESQSLKQPAEKPEKHYKPFTEEDARRVDLPELLKNVRYQIYICDTFGMDVLAALMEKARGQSAAI